MMMMICLWWRGSCSQRRECCRTAVQSAEGKGVVSKSGTTQSGGLVCAWVGESMGGWVGGCKGVRRFLVSPAPGVYPVPGVYQVDGVEREVGARCAAPPAVCDGCGFFAVASVFLCCVVSRRLVVVVLVALHSSFFKVSLFYYQ